MRYSLIASILILENRKNMHQRVHLHFYMHADFNYRSEVANLFGHAHYFMQSVSKSSNNL